MVLFLGETSTYQNLPILQKVGSLNLDVEWNVKEGNVGTTFRNLMQMALIVLFRQRVGI